MSYTIQDIEQLARASLSSDDRSILAERLLNDSSESDIMALENDPDFVAEMERRVEAIRNGTSTSYTIDEAKAKIHAKHEWK